MNSRRQAPVNQVPAPRPHRSVTALRTAFASGAFNDLPVAVLCFAGNALIDANQEWVAISGLDVAACEGDGWLGAVHADDRDAASACTRPGTGETDVETTVRIGPAGGPAGWFQARCREINDDSAAGVGLRVVTFTAVGDHRSTEARLLHLSTHDGLTGLATRANFVGQVEHALATRTGLAGLLFIDLDHFKAVNDHLGHRCGDDVLHAACKRIQATIRSTEFAGRLGGDEIGVFCPQIDSYADAFALAERIGAALAAPFSVDAQIVTIDASIGIAFTNSSLTDNSERNAESLLERADQAMYVAKAAGGGRWATLDILGTPRLDRPLDDDPVLAAVRADIDRAEERTILAWKQCIVTGEFERSARLSAVREALRRVRVLLRIPVTVDVVSTADGGEEPRTGRLHAELDNAIAIAQATGMISQRTGFTPGESAALLAE